LDVSQDGPDELDNSDDAGTKSNSTQMIPEYPPNTTQHREANLPLVPGPVELAESTGNGHLVTRQEEFSSPV